MTIYQGENDIEIRLDTGVSLINATLINIRVVKPSGSAVTWVATRYGTTNEITYTASSTDLDEIGDYVLRAYIEWNTSKHLGEAATIQVLDPNSSRSGIDKLIQTFQIYYRFLDVQTAEEFEDEENTDADLTYDAFELYAELADDELNNLLVLRSVSSDYITNTQRNALLSHLIADYFEQGNPDWNFRSQSQAPGVSFSRGQNTGPREAFNKLFESIANSAKLASITSGRGASYSPVRIKDAANYPNRWKRTLIPAYNQFEDGFDESEVEDLGNEDTSNSEWS